jgi:hypothetical protein
MKTCHACGWEWTEKETPGFSAECPKCAAYLHCCLNCKFYAPGAHHDCREPQADPVREKDGRNTCEYFLLADRGPAGAGDAKGRSAAARAKLDQLFGGGPGDARK